MTALGNAFVKAHGKNIARYHRLLRTRLSDVERNYIESRILEERAALQALATVDDPEPTVDAAVAAHAAVVRVIGIQSRSRSTFNCRVDGI